jgi:hypothetical protein
MLPFSTLFLNEGVSNAWASFFYTRANDKGKKISNQVSLIG